MNDEREESDEREETPRETPGESEQAESVLEDLHMATTQSVLSHDLLDEIRDALPALPPGGRVGLLGGSFNPPHLGHVMLAYAVLATESLDALWVLPAASHPFGKDETEYEGFRARYEMCERAFAALDAPVEIVDVEQHLPRPNYTYRLLHALHAARAGIARAWSSGRTSSTNSSAGPSPSRSSNCARSWSSRAPDTPARPKRWDGRA